MSNKVNLVPHLAWYSHRLPQCCGSAHTRMVHENVFAIYDMQYDQPVTSLLTKPLYYCATFTDTVVCCRLADLEDDTTSQVKNRISTSTCVFLGVV